MIQPLYLTDEERDAMAKMWDDYNKALASNPGSDNGGRSPNGVHNPGYSVVASTRHSWVSTVLVISTVYTCKHCGAKKEKSKNDYCEEM